VAPRAEVRRDGTICGEKALGLSWRLEPRHPPLALARRLVGIFRAIIPIAMRPMFHTGQPLACRRLIAPQPIGHDQPWHVREPLEQLADECLGSLCIPPMLHEHVEEMSVLIHRPPQIMTLLVEGEKDFI
jgi:hypothetical protein